MNVDVIDGVRFISDSLLRAAIADWPSSDWSGWHVYGEGKKASRNVCNIPESIACVLRKIACGVDTHDDVSFPDFSCYAAGLHEIPAGANLGWHRDANRHPVKPWKRTRTAILYLDEGGSLLFRGRNFRKEIQPKRGRLVVFDSDDFVEHAVESSGVIRRSLAMFFYCDNSSCEGRTSACFARTQPNCKHCGSPTEFKLIEDRARYYSCSRCGCESSDLTYFDVSSIYAADDYRNHYHTQAEESIKNVSTNLTMIRDAKVETKTALDVGCLDGATLAGLHRDGWIVHGFDVNREIPAFVENLFGIPAEQISVGKEYRCDGRQFGAVISRDVIEHVADHKSHFSELVKSVAPGGILHLQTPRPVDNPNDNLVYQTQHLQILSTDAVESMFINNGMMIENKLFWDQGQAWVGRKPK